MSFSLGPWLAEASEKGKHPVRELSRTGWDASLQSMDGPVLGLHSCRALSPVPRPEHERASGSCHLQN